MENVIKLQEGDRCYQASTCDKVNKKNAIMNIKKLSVELLLCPQQTESHLKQYLLFIHTLMFLGYITISLFGFIKD